MKRRLILKYADLAVQILMLFPLLALAGKPSERFLYAYFTVGSSQIISSALHCVAGLQSERRKCYAHVIGTTLILLLIGCALAGADVFLHGAFERTALMWLGSWLVGPTLVFLGIGGPVLAGWYFSICLEEVVGIEAATRHRREIHWKL